MMGRHVDDALALHAQQFNCAQAVFGAFVAEAGMEVNDTLKAAAAFGAGMGRLQETCGAVTGALMVLGCRTGMVHAGDTAAKEATYARVQEFVRTFRIIHGTITCRELLRCDLRTPEGMAYYHEKELGSTVCVECIRTACLLLEKQSEPIRRPLAIGLPGGD